MTKSTVTSNQLRKLVVDASKDVLALHRGEEFSFFVETESADIGLTRVGAYNRITDNIESTTGGALIVAAIGQRLGMTSSYATGGEVANGVKRALEIAHDAPPLPWFKGFPRFKQSRMHHHTRTADAKERGAVIAKAITMFEDNGFKLSGVCASANYAKWLYSSNNKTYDDSIHWSGAQTMLDLAVTDDNNTFEAIIGAVGKSPRSMGLDAALADGLDQILLQEQLPVVEIGPGAYDTVFEAPALSHLLEFTSWYGINGRQYHRKGTFTAKQTPGDRIFGENITITDEPFHPRNPCWIPTDNFGVPKQSRFPFVDSGVLKRLWYDYLDAQRNDVEPTGHGTELRYGPGHLVLAPGNGPIARATAVNSLRDGLLVRSLHYTRLDDINAGSFTGMTRYGTFLVNDGEIVARVPNLRFVDSIPRMLGNVAWLSRKSVPVLSPETYGINVTPVYIVPSFVRINGFQVTGATPLHS